MVKHCLTILWVHTERGNLKKNLIANQCIIKNLIKNEIKSYDGRINTNFHNNIIPKEGSHCVCSSVTLIDSDFRMGKNYYLQVFLGECKYFVKENKMNKFINDELEISYDDSDNFYDCDNDCLALIIAYKEYTIEKLSYIL